MIPSDRIGDERLREIARNFRVHLEELEALANDLLEARAYIADLRAAAPDAARALDREIARRRATGDKTVGQR